MLELISVLNGDLYCLAKIQIFLHSFQRPVGVHILNEQQKVCFMPVAREEFNSTLWVASQSSINFRAVTIDALINALMH